MMPKMNAPIYSYKNPWIYYQCFRKLENIWENSSDFFSYNMFGNFYLVSQISYINSDRNLQRPKPKPRPKLNLAEIAEIEIEIAIYFNIFWMEIFNELNDLYYGNKMLVFRMAKTLIPNHEKLYYGNKIPVVWMEILVNLMNFITVIKCQLFGWKFLMNLMNFIMVIKGQLFGWQSH